MYYVNYEEEKNRIIEAQAQELVNHGMFETIQEAWEEALYICMDSDAFEHLADYE